MAKEKTARRRLIGNEQFDSTKVNGGTGLRMESPLETRGAAQPLNPATPTPKHRQLMERVLRSKSIATSGLKLISLPPSHRVEQRLAALMAVGVIAAAFTTMGLNWMMGRTVSNALGGFLPFSDAHGYYTCANSLIDLGRFASDSIEWCSRRPIYSSLLAFFIAVGGRDLHIALLIQAAFVSLAIVALAREVMRFAGLIGALLVVTVLAFFAALTAFPTTLSENAGLALGALAFATLLRGAENGRTSMIFAGTALMSVALNARAGCFFVLPMLVLWAAFNAHARKENIVGAMALAASAIVLGFALGFTLMALNGAPLAQAHGNFSLTLYGLSIGGKGWMQVLSDHPELASLPDAAANSEIYRRAIDNIIQRPELILRALVANFVEGWGRGVSLGGGTGLGGGAGLRAYVLWILWLIGFAAIAVRFREPRHMLVGFLTVGGLMSCPFIIQDGGARIFAATIGVDATQAGLGASLICRLLARVPGIQGPVAQKGRDTVPGYAIALASVLLIGTVAAYTPLRRLFALPLLHAAPCPGGENTLVTYLGKGSEALVVTAEGQAGLYPAKARLSALLRASPSLSDELQMPTPYSFLLGYQRWAGAGDVSTTYPIRWRGDLSPYYGRAIQVCFVPDQPASSNLWGTRYVARSVDLPARTNPGR